MRRPRKPVPFTRIQELPVTVSKTRMYYIDWRKLATTPDIAELLVRSMVAFNDLQSWGYINRRLQLETNRIARTGTLGSGEPPLGLDQMRGHYSYAFRMATVVLMNCQDLIAHIKQSRPLVRVVAAPDVRKHFDEARRLLEENKGRIREIRDAMGGHFDSRENSRIVEAIAHFAKSNRRGKVEPSTKPMVMRFQAGDDVLGHIAMNQIWNTTPETQPAVDQWSSALVESLFYFFQIFIQEAVNQFHLAR